MFFFRDTKLRGEVIDGLRQPCQAIPSRDSDPEHSWRFRGWKEPVALYRKLECRLLNLRQLPFELLGPLRWFFSDKLQRYVKRFNLHPTRIGSKSTDAFDEASDPLTDSSVNVKCEKEAHGNWIQPLRVETAMA